VATSSEYNSNLKLIMHPADWHSGDAFQVLSRIPGLPTPSSQTKRGKCWQISMPRAGFEPVISV